MLKKYNRTIINVVSAIISYISILIYCSLLFTSYSYDFMVGLIFIVILYFYIKSNCNFDKRTKIYSITLSLIISIILVIGNRVNLSMDSVSNIFTFKSILVSIFNIIGFVLMFYRIFGNIFIYTKDKKKFNILNDKKQLIGNKKFICLVFFMVACWGIYFLRYYPAILTPDSHYVIHYSEFKILSDHHTFVHTWFFALFFYIGRFIFGSKTMGIAFYTLVQMFLLAIIFNIGIKYFYEKGLKKIYCVCLWLLFALSPLHGYYSVTLWRDILFSASFLLILISLYEFIINNYNVSKKYLVYFIFGCFIMLFFRNNGIYIYLFMLPFLFFCCSNKKLKMRTIYLLIFIIYFIVKGPVFDVLGVEKSKTVEAYSIPLQQISRVIASDKKLDKSTLKKLEKYIDVSKIKESYKPHISDPIKSITYSDALSKNSAGFIKLWSSILIKYPDVYIDAYLSQTLGYWYPSVDYWAIGNQIRSINDWEQVDCHSLLNDKINKIVDEARNNKLPFGIFIWSLGLQFIIILVASFILLYNKRINKLLSFVPLYALWLSIMVAAPVFSELRYVYALFICAPFCLIISCINKRDKCDIVN